MPDKRKTTLHRGTVYYDADCALCVGLLNRWGERLRRRGFSFKALREGIAENRQPFPPEDFYREMKLCTSTGQWLGGAGAVMYLMRAVPWLKPFAWLIHLPGFRFFAHAAYCRIAANRHCADGTCRLAPRKPIDRWLPLVVFPVMVFFLGRTWVPWIWMWALAFVLFGGCKWLTFRDATHRTEGPNLPRKLAYLFLWPGMDARAFLRQKAAAPPLFRDWAFALAKTLLGCSFLLLLLPFLPERNPLIAGWAGMIGIILVLHFGVFHLLALFWQRVGYDARPLMRLPLLAASLADFWGRRWNLAFHHLATTYLYQPMRRRFAPSLALLLAFFISGLVHELVITIPARGSYGLPTLFFLLQGTGFLLERQAVFRKRPPLRRCLAWLCLLPPAFLLFPPVFIHHIVLPMLGVCRASPTDS